MRSKVFSLLNEAQQKMSGYAVYMNYKLINFSVLAEPAALLSVSVEINNDAVDIEEVADVAIPEDDQFALIPKESENMFAICKAVGIQHPEYKIEQKKIDEESDAEDPEMYILCTMPEMDENRHDFGMDYVKTVYDEAIAKIDLVNGAYTAKIAKALMGADAQEIDEANEELKKIGDQNREMCDSYKEMKEKQIETAYQEYLKKQAEKESAELERQAALGAEAGKQMNMGAFGTDAG